MKPSVRDLAARPSLPAFGAATVLVACAAIALAGTVTGPPLNQWEDPFPVHRIETAGPWLLALGARGARLQSAADLEPRAIFEGVTAGALDGDGLCVLARPGELRVYAIQWGRPVERDRLLAPETFVDLELEADRLVAAGDRGVWIYRRDGPVLRLTAHLPSIGAVHRVVLGDGWIAALEPGVGVEFFAGEPPYGKLGTLEDGSPCWDGLLHRGILWLARGELGVHAVDVTDPASPRLLPRTVPGGQGGYALALAGLGPVVLAACGLGGVEVWGVGGDGNPVLVETMETGGWWAEGVVPLQKEKWLIALGLGGLRLFPGPLPSMEPSLPAGDREDPVGTREGDAEPADRAADAPPRLRLLGPYPNPATGPVRWRVLAGRGRSVDVRLYDAAGRSVMAWEARRSRGEPIEFSWDGRDRRGRPVPAGVYFLRASDGRSVAVRRVVRLSR
jgi:hypothetical protein